MRGAYVLLQLQPGGEALFVRKDLAWVFPALRKTRRRGSPPPGGFLPTQLERRRCNTHSRKSDDAPAAAASSDFSGDKCRAPAGQQGKEEEPVAVAPAGSRTRHESEWQGRELEGVVTPVLEKEDLLAKWRLFYRCVPDRLDEENVHWHGLQADTNLWADERIAPHVRARLVQKYLEAAARNLAAKGGSRSDDDEAHRSDDDDDHPDRYHVWVIPPRSQEEEGEADL